MIFVFGPTAAKLGTPSPQQACAEQRYFVEHGAIARELLSGRQLSPAQQPLVAVQSTAGPVVCGAFTGLPAKNPFLSVLTAMFIHAGWMHLLGNMLFLFVFGNNVEDRLGRRHFLLFYLVSGYLATYAFAMLNPASISPLVGASGAIAGTLGAYLYLFPRAKVTSLVPFLLFLPLRFPAWLVLGSWFLLQLPVVQGLLGVPADDTIAYLAHVAGFTAGFLYLLLVLDRGRALSRLNPRRRRARPLEPDGLLAQPWPLVSAESGENDPYGAGNPFPYRYPTPPVD